MTQAHDALCDAITTYLHANDYLPEMFKLQLTDGADRPDGQLLRTGLRAAIDRSTLSPEMFEGLTEAAIDTQDEVDDWLGSLWAFVYDGAPAPDLPG